MQSNLDFIVIDTEGKDELREIAIINSQGQLIYQAFAKGHPNNDRLKFDVKPLKQIIFDFFNLAQDKQIIFHYANHDLQVLKNSCRKTSIPWQNIISKCTCELAKDCFPNLSSYSLEHLSKHLSLKVDNRYFNPNQAHTAKYDAQFTYQLYQKILQQPLKNKLKNLPNPFGSSRVDTPFQYHLDFQEIYQSEFETLKSILTDIKYDLNHQSKGILVIGEPGSGKTHLMMRLAQELLKTNRLLFIRQPNNSDSVLYHIYSRILESFVEKVPESGCTQLEHLLANSFTKIINANLKTLITRKDREILQAIQTNPLHLYQLGTEGTEKKRAYWQHIEQRTNEWWVQKYSAAGYSTQIIKGIVKFCSYTDPKRKELVTQWLAADELNPEELEKIGLDNWNTEMSREAFSLEAISVFSKLSILDEPLIIVFDQLEALGLEHNKRILLSFGEAIKEIFTHVGNSLIIFNLFPDRWEQFQAIFDGSIVDRVSQYKVQLNRPDNEELKKILELKAQVINIELKALFTSSELETILSHRSIRAVLNSAADYYRYKVKGISPPQISPSSEALITHSVNTTVQQKIQKLEDELTQLQKIVREIATVVQLNYTEFDELETTSTDNLVYLGLGEDQGNTILNYLQEQKSLLERNYNKLQIISDSDDLGKLLALEEALIRERKFEVDYLRLGKKKLPDHLVIKTKKQNYFLGFLQVDGTSFTSRLKNCNELTLDYKDTRFWILRDERKPRITGRVGKEEIEKLQNAPNGKFVIMEKEDRIKFELIYKLITDIQNRDFEMDLNVALPVLFSYMKNYWLLKIFLEDV